VVKINQKQLIHVCLMTEACAQGCYLAVEWPGVEPVTLQSLVRHKAIRLPLPYNIQYTQPYSCHFWALQTCSAASCPNQPH